MHHFQLRVALLLPDLELALLQDLEDYGVLGGGGAEGLLEVSVGRNGAFGDVGEDLVDLEDFVEVGFTRGVSWVRCRSSS